MISALGNTGDHPLWQQQCRRALWVVWPLPPGYWSVAAPKTIYSSAALLHLKSLARLGHLHYAVYFTAYIANVPRMDRVWFRKCLDSETRQLHWQLPVPRTVPTLLLHTIITASAIAVQCPWSPPNNWYIAFMYMYMTGDVRWMPCWCVAVDRKTSDDVRMWRWWRRDAVMK